MLVPFVSGTFSQATFQFENHMPLQPQFFNELIIVVTDHRFASSAEVVVGHGPEAQMPFYESEEERGRKICIYT